MKSTHKIYFKSSRILEDVRDNSVDLIVCSPPYPMIEIWDNQFSDMYPEINMYLEKGLGVKAFKSMHSELDKTWEESYRVLKNGGIACINIGDATRKIGNSFQLYPNHSRILNFCSNLGFSVLPEIIWHKQSNKPNKFMGSGMLPSNAYISHEHEYILILRKGPIRKFSEDEKKLRNQSAYFWEERNTWFSDIWMDLKGVDQTLNKKTETRDRSAAFPFELAYRLINMYSKQGDMILDPFLGTGTTTIAALTSNRNSIGYEIEENLKSLIEQRILGMKKFCNDVIYRRLYDHLIFITNRIKNDKEIKYRSKNYGFKVITKQEKEILFHFIKNIGKITDGLYEATYFKEYDLKKLIEELDSRFNINKSLFNDEFKPEPDIVQRKLF
ncbi:MAG: site-specific DNA-methyltransferase [Candidatus Lokiarchaeota archaeon]|nr:site-specific DNA-methyltransferase [Candidatus Lokiarchaeota archaeon]